MKVNQPIKQVERALAAIKSGDYNAQSQLADLLSGDSISVGNIEGSKAVAIGKDINIVIQEQILPYGLQFDLQSLLDQLRLIPGIGARIDGQIDLRSIMPYLSTLHYESMQSGLLSTLNPRTKDPTYSGRQVTVDQVYTPLDTHTRIRRDYQGRILWNILQEDEESTPLSAMEAANYFDHLVILGDPGSGKSTFVGFLSLCLTGHCLEIDNGWLDRLRLQGWNRPALLPIHVTLRDFAQDMGTPSIHGTAKSLLDHIARQLDRCGCRPEAIGVVREALSDGNALIILDGLDEVPAESRLAVRDAVTKTLQAQAYTRSRVLITCRILSYANPEWQIPGTNQVILSPFDEGKIRHFVQAWYTASQARGLIEAQTAQARIIDLITAVDDPQLKDMATNPMLLTVMAIVHNHRGALPRETARLYDECVEILLLKWKPDEARHLRELLDLPDETDLHRILWQIAYEAHEKAGDRTIAADIPKKEVMSIAAEDHFDGDWHKAQLFCDYVEERAGLLVGRGGDDKRRIFAFPHRTFQEYLAGCYLADDVDFVQLIDEKARAGANWRQVVLLSIGHMYFNKTDRNQPLLAAQLILQDEPEQIHDWTTVALAGDMLALIGRTAVEKHKFGKNLLPLARKRLAELLDRGHLATLDRAAAGRTLSELGDPRPGVGIVDNLPDIIWLLVRGTRRYEFITDTGHMGTYDISDFYIAKYPVTFAQFQVFIDDPNGFHNPIWWEELVEDDNHRASPGVQAFKYNNHPRENVSWYDAVAFCRWLSDKTDQEIRLPFELEWQWAATSGERLSSSSHMGNTYETSIGQTSAVGIFLQGAVHCGAHDMRGNVWEWCQNDHRNPGESGTSSETTRVVQRPTRVVRGGSWNSRYISFVDRPSGYDPRHRDLNLGFRIVRSLHSDRGLGS